MTATAQRGQALVAVMVVMLILFALAGAVAVGASTLLAGRGNSGAVAEDLQVRSAVNDSVAQLAGATRRCGAPPPLPSPSPTPSPSATPSPLSLGLPNGTTQTALCAREDAVVSGSLQRHAGGGAGGLCTSINLQVTANGRLAVMFDARSRSGGWAYLTDDPADTACTFLQPPGAPAPPCSQRFSPVVGGVGQVALSCDFTSGKPLILRVRLAALPALVFTAAQDASRSPSQSATGSVYLLASGTGLSRPDFEESVLFVRGDGLASQLLHEAPLP